MYRAEKRKNLEFREVEVVSSPHKSYEKEIRKQRYGVPDLPPGYPSRGAQAADRETRNALWLRRKRVASQSDPLPYKPARWLLRREAG